MPAHFTLTSDNLTEPKIFGHPRQRPHRSDQGKGGLAGISRIAGTPHATVQLAAAAVRGALAEGGTP